MNQTAMNRELRVALVGYGQMGREIERCAAGRNVDIVARYDSRTPITESSVADFDVAIEFTRPGVAPGNIAALMTLGRPVVVGTTGWLDRLPEIELMAAERNGRIVHASNFSIGVNIFFRLVREAGRMMNEQAIYDAAVHEIHHVRKADSPSGTALTIGTILLEELARKTHILPDASHGPIPSDALHVSSQRLGETVGTHVVTFDSEADTIELAHRARNRSGFALGALYAARWIVEQPPGIYRFEEIF
jgi:4-hydroxy-tetrahydrodipicolinate reductase